MRSLNVSDNGLLINASMVANNSPPPSKTGKGMRLSSAKLMLMNERKSKNIEVPCSKLLAVVAIIINGPPIFDTSSLRKRFLKTLVT